MTTKRRGATRCGARLNSTSIAKIAIGIALMFTSGFCSKCSGKQAPVNEFSAGDIQGNRTELQNTDFGPSFDPQQWELLGGSWSHEPDGTPPALRIARKESVYRPPHRSPTHVALWRQPVEVSFEMIVDVISTNEDYGHRDVCLFLGWQDPAHFYYVHLAKETDPHANQIFIVDGADRKAISLGTSDGTPWDDARHRIRIRRNTDNGEIAVWFDDSEEPVMRARDRTFLNGRIGLGSFDDNADFYRLEIFASDQSPENPPTKQGIK